MSDRIKNIKRTFSGFLRYLRDGMTGEERNSFERELQKDPFASEAYEGLSSVSPEDAFDDVRNLKKRIKKRVSRKQRFIVYRIAASVSVLMIISSIFIIVERNKPGRQLSDTDVVSEMKQPVSKEVQNSLVLNDEQKESGQGTPAVKKAPSESINTKEVKEEENTSISKNRTVDLKSADAVSEIQQEAGKEDASYERAAPASMPGITRKKALIAPQVKGKIISSDDNSPVSGVRVYLKDTRNSVMTDSAGYFNIALPDSGSRTLVADYSGMELKEFKAIPDSQLIVSLSPADRSISSEAVVTGYGKAASKSRKEMGMTYQPPSPRIGKAAFDEYIRDNITRPDSSESGQRVVVEVNFIVRTNGSLDSIIVVRSPGTLFSDEAIRLIRSGPAWNPAVKDGKPVEDKVNYKIVFR